jgi:hypothetical protein
MSPDECACIEIALHSMLPQSSAKLALGVSARESLKPVRENSRISDAANGCRRGNRGVEEFDSCEECANVALVKCEYWSSSVRGGVISAIRKLFGSSGMRLSVLEISSSIRIRVDSPALSYLSIFSDSWRISDGECAFGNE